jgi:acyl-CoA synthetase (AMP-forming)/AMP-acid ligase II
MWNLNKYKSNVAMIDEDGTKLTYSELSCVADELKKAVGDRCLVVSLCRNTIGSAVGYITFINNKIVPLMLNVNLEKELRQNLLDEYKPKFLWLPSEMKADFPAWNAVYEYYDYCLIKTDYSVEYPLYDELALLLTTSGSTGSPKFVRQSYENIEANTAIICGLP